MARSTSSFRSSRLIGHPLRTIRWHSCWTSASLRPRSPGSDPHGGRFTGGHDGGGATRGVDLAHTWRSWTAPPTVSVMTQPPTGPADPYGEAPQQGQQPGYYPPPGQPQYEPPG